ncbi:MAG: flagellar FliL protein [Gammaproteobacteria bacterium]|jgi:flagellar FliL protein
MQKILLNAILVISLLAGQMGGQAWSAEDETEKVKTETAYISLGEPLVLNLSSQRSQNTFLQMTADIWITNVDSEAIIKAHIPAMRHQLIMLLSEQPANDMKAPSKREDIRQTAKLKIQDLIAKLSNNKDVGDVLFSSVLVQ